LESQGFRYRNCVDILDAGPSIEAVVKEVETIRNSFMATVVIDEASAGSDGDKWLVANPALDKFCCTEIQLGKGIKIGTEDAFPLKASQAKKLNVEAGQQVLVSQLFGRSTEK
jgi:arginine N-succinyltransferase